MIMHCMENIFKENDFLSLLLARFQFFAGFARYLNVILNTALKLMVNKELKCLEQANMLDLKITKGN